MKYIAAKNYVICLLLLVFFSKDQCSNKYVIGVWPAGLGSGFHAVLNHLEHAQSQNKAPVVYWNERSYYHNPNGFNGSYNVWEYYFEPVSAHSYRPGDRVNNSYGGDLWGSPNGKGFHYKTAEKKKHRASQLVKKYIRVKEIVQKKIDEFFHMNMEGRTTIGIHLRGTDKAIEERPVSPESIIKKALEFDGENTQFLLATDEQRLLDRMIQLLEGKKVIYYDCYRSQNGLPLHVRREKPPRSQLGEDIVVEMYLLSKCDVFVHTASNVSAVVLYLNPELKNILVRQ